jgi:hypothetical protein
MGAWSTVCLAEGLKAQVQLPRYDSLRRRPS